MRRAKVFRRELDGKWRVMYSATISGYWHGLRAFPTHTAALEHALTEVGLTENTEKEKNR